MIAPGSRVATTHFEDVLDQCVDSSVGVCPDIVEQGEGVNVYLSFHWKFTKKKVETWYGRCAAQLQKAS